MSEKSAKISGEGSSEEKPICGVIMPISATVNHSEKHWRDVQALLHRAISDAGFRPRNVWESTTSDRISERIIGNIFDVPIAVADISDLNPNVMLELGLRLASKKPTVVVANAGGDIPFDIRDFHATFYPADMSMLEMEEFFRKLRKALNDKHAASSTPGYKPFLGHVIVDVASPETRELGVNDLLLSRLDEMSARMSAIEGAVSRPRPSPSRPVQRPTRGTVVVEIPEERLADFEKEAAAAFEVDEIRLKDNQDGIATLEVYYSGVGPRQSGWSLVSELAQRHGGDTQIPF